MFSFVYFLFDIIYIYSRALCVSGCTQLLSIVVPVSICATNGCTQFIIVVPVSILNSSTRRLPVLPPLLLFLFFVLTHISSYSRCYSFSWYRGISTQQLLTFMLDLFNLLTIPKSLPFLFVSVFVSLLFFLFSFLSWFFLSYCCQNCIVIFDTIVLLVSILHGSLMTIHCVCLFVCLVYVLCFNSISI